MKRLSSRSGKFALVNDPAVMSPEAGFQEAAVLGAVRTLGGLYGNNDSQGMRASIGTVAHRGHLPPPFLLSSHGGLSPGQLTHSVVVGKMRTTKLRSIRFFPSFSLSM